MTISEKRRLSEELFDLITELELDYYYFGQDPHNSEYCNNCIETKRKVNEKIAEIFSKIP